MNFYKKILISAIGKLDKCSVKYRNKKEEVTTMIFVLNLCHFINVLIIYELICLLDLEPHFFPKYYNMFLWLIILTFTSTVVHYYFLILRRRYVDIAVAYDKQIKKNERGKSYLMYVSVTLVLFILLGGFAIIRSVILKS